MGNRTVVVDLIVNTAKWTAGFQKASHDMASATTNAETKTRALQTQVGLLGVGMTTFAALGVRAWARFDQAMSRVEATGGSAAERINDLTEAAKSDQVTQLGYSATEAAESIYELTKAGVDANDVIGGALSGSLALAAAETMDAAESASIMASVLTQFNKEGTDAAHVSDLLVAAAGKAQGSAHDLGFAFKQSGLVAHQFGLSLEETTGTLALFANAGLIGSDAGTSLRTMLLHLVGPSGKSAELMKELGFSAYDASGQFKSMEELTNSLVASLKGKTEEERNSALATIFGADAVRAASLLYEQGGDAVVEWTNKVNDAGYAQEVARKRMDNLNGDIKILNSTWEKFLIGMGESADAPLRGLVQAATAVVDAFADMPPAVQGLTMALAGGGGLGILGVLAIGQVLSALSTLQTGLVTTGVVGEAAAAKIVRGMRIATIATGALGVAATVGFALWATEAAKAAAAVDGYVATLDEAGAATESTVGHIREVLTEGQDLGWNDFFGNYDLISNAEKMGIAVDDLAGYILNEKDAVDRVNAAWKEYQGSTWDFGATGRHVDIQQMTTALDNQKGSLEEARKEKEIQSKVNDRLAGTEGGVAEATGETGDAMAGATDSIEEQTKAIQSNIDAWHELAGVHMDAAEAQANYEQALDDTDEAIKAAQTDTDKYSKLLQENRSSLDLSTQAGRDAQDALQGLAKASLENMQASYDNGASTEELTEQMRRARNQFIGAAMDAGLTREAARQLARDWGLIPENVETTVKANDKATGTIRSIKSELAMLRDQTIYVTTVRREAFERARINDNRSRPGFAGGGALYGGTPGHDSIPIMGMPGEHMLTVKDVKAMGGQEAVYAFRQALHAGNTGFMAMAKGGAVPNKRSLRGQPLSYWQGALRTNLEQLQLIKRISDLKKDLSLSGKERLSSIDRRIATEELKSARRELDHSRIAERMGSAADFRRWMAASERAAQARGARADAREQRAEARTDTTRSIRRGEIMDSLTGGLDGVYSITDQARGLIDSGTVSGKSKTQLWDAIGKAEKAAKGLYGELDKIELKMEQAVEKADELRQIKEAVAGSIAGGFGLADVQGPVNPWSGVQGAASGSQMLAAAQSYATKAKTLGEKLVALQKKGFTGAILQEIAMMGVDAGVAAADSLLALDTSSVTAFNTAYSDIEKWSNYAGEAVTGGFYKGGLAAADGIVKGLEAEQDKIEAAIEKMAKGMQDALKRALGIKSPSRVFAGLMTYVGDGTVLGLKRQEPRVSAAAADLLNVASGNFVNASDFASNTAGKYGNMATGQGNVTNIKVEVTSNNAVAEKDSVIVNKALQVAASIGS